MIVTIAVAPCRTMHIPRAPSLVHTSVDVPWLRLCRLDRERVPPQSSWIFGSSAPLWKAIWRHQAHWVRSTLGADLNLSSHFQVEFMPRIWIKVKVIYPKYSKHWPYTVAHTIDCVCSKMLNHGLNHGFFLSLFKLIPCPIYWIVYTVLQKYTQFCLFMM